VGMAALRTIIQDPELELAGVFVYSDAKKGKDAGQLVGLAPTGVCTTTDREEILATDADVVIHCASGVGPMGERDDDVMALLRSGKNVISTMAYTSPVAHGEDYAATLEAACREGSATLMGGGIAPDCVSSWLPAALTRMCTDVKHVSMLEIDDFALVTNETFMIDLAGIGKDPAEFTPSLEAGQYMLWVVCEAVDLLGRNFGVRLEPSGFEFELYSATRDFEIPVGKVRKGTVCGARLGLTGMLGEEDFVRLEYVYSAQRDHPSFPEIPYDTRYVIELEGSPSVRTTIDMAPSLNAEAEASRTSAEIQAVMHSTAACAVRAIPAVCSAAPGLFTMPVYAGWTIRNRPRQ
jgi:2,4-diaminopentanoate dehydrogenase